MYAVIRSGGKQYRVQAGDTIRLERLAGDVGSEIEFGEVLMVENDGGVAVGTPLVPKASVQVRVVGHSRARKVIVFKKRRKKQYRRKRGHRQEFTEVRVEEIRI